MKDTMAILAGIALGLHIEFGLPGAAGFALTASLLYLARAVKQ